MRRSDWASAWILRSGLLSLSCVVATAAVAHAAPNDWAEGSDAADDGATRDFYNRGAVLAWRNMGGDWTDSGGTPQGDVPWTTVAVEDTDEARYVEWDVTALVQAWVDGSIANQGFFLHTDGGGPIDFDSREAGANPPELVVDGATLAATADTYTEPSTFQQQGENARLRVGDGQNLLVRFDVSGLAGVVGSATLRIHTTAQFGGGADIGVFSPAPGRQGPAPAYEAGLADGYDMDEGIGTHADVIFFADFEADDWESGWTRTGGSFDVVGGGTEFGFDALAGRAMRTWIPEGENTGLNTAFEFMDETGAEPDEVYLRYYLRLGSTWDQSVDGGKLPGIAGRYGRAGWGGRRSDGSNGWSARGLFRESVPSANNPLAGFTPVGSYVYHADQETTFGDNFLWAEGWGDEAYGGVLHNERWYCMETYVRMNTPGERDGVLRAWVDGRLSLDKTDLRFRDIDALHIEEVWMNIFHGGTDVSPRDQHAFIDNVVIATSYIGPMTGAPTPPPPPTDGGTPPGDSGTPPTDGSAPPVDADTGPGPDGGSGAMADGGCGCRVVASPTDSFGWLALLALLAVRRR